MESIARILLASADLIEAEGRTLKRQAGRIFLAFAIGVVALAMILAGLCFVLLGLFAWLSLYIHPHGAALVLGGVAFVIALAATLTAKKLFA